MKTKNLHNQLVEWRQDLHMNPQISFEEEYASNKIVTLLKDFGIEVHQGIAKTGVGGVLKKGSSNKSIAMDIILNLNNKIDNLSLYINCFFDFRVG